MNKGAITRFCGGHGGAEAARSAFYLLLATLIAVEVTRSAFQAARFFHKPDPVADCRDWIPFPNQPSTAAILKQRAESCYAQARNAAWDYALSPVHGPRQAANGLRQDRGFAGLAGPDRGSPPQVPWLAPLEELRATIQDLNIDLDQKLPGDLLREPVKINSWIASFSSLRSA